MKVEAGRDWKCFVAAFLIAWEAILFVMKIYFRD